MYSIYTIKGNNKQGYFPRCFHKNLTEEELKEVVSKVKNFKNPTAKYFIVKETAVQKFLAKYDAINEKIFKSWKKPRHPNHKVDITAYKDIREYI